MDRSVNVYDEGIILVGAERVLSGDLPHRDFHDLYGPAQFYILAALYKIFGASVLVERAWDTLVRAGCVVLVLIVVGRTAPARLALLAAIASLLGLATFRAYGYPLFPALAATLATLAFLVPALDRPNPAAGLIAAGACAGVVMLFRYDIGAAVFGVGCVLVLVSVLFQRRDITRGLGQFTRLMIWFGIGFAMIVAPVAVAFARQGVFPDLIFDVITYPANAYVKQRSLPFPRPWTLWRHPNAFAVYIPIVVSAAALPTLIIVMRDRWRRGRLADSAKSGPAPPVYLPVSMLGLILLTLVFIAKGSVRVSVVQMAAALVTSVALVGVLAQRIPGRTLAARALAFSAVMAASVLAVSCLYLGLGRAVQNVAWATDPASWEPPLAGTQPVAGSCHVPPGLERMACFRIAPPDAEAALYSQPDAEVALYIQQHTAPDAAVLVGLSRHDVIFINNVLLYFAMKRKPATKWYHFDPGLQTTASIQLEMIEELRRVRPSMIVVEENRGDWGEPNDSALSSGTTLLDDYIKSAFEPVATFGPNTVLRLRPPAPS